jgi:hypothetical protein
LPNSDSNFNQRLKKSHHELPQLFQRSRSSQKRSRSNLIRIQIPNTDLSQLLQYANIKSFLCTGPLGHCFTANCQNWAQTYPRTANFALRRSTKNAIAFICGSLLSKQANIGRLETGHLNMSCLQTSYPICHTENLNWNQSSGKIRRI